MAAGPEVWWRKAKEEIKVANDLKAIGHNTQAYHHAGQAIEFALKAIYMKRRGLADLPDACKGVKWHSLPHIAAQAGLDPDLVRLRTSKSRYQNWLTVREWNSNARFPGQAPSHRDIKDLLLAACHRHDGIMTWLETIFRQT